MTQAHEDCPHIELEAPENGRVTIPAPIRRAAHIEPGQTLVMHVEDGRVIVETRANLIARTKQDFAANSSGANLVDELIVERRAEAEREASE